MSTGEAEIFIDCTSDNEHDPIFVFEQAGPAWQSLYTIPGGSQSSTLKLKEPVGAVVTFLACSAPNNPDTWPVGPGKVGCDPTATTVTIEAPHDFSISANPTSLQIVQGGSGTSTLTTKHISLDAEIITLAASGLPSGATASFSANPVIAGASPTMTINVPKTSPAGTYTVTITGTGIHGVHSITVALTVTGVPIITNGDFETGDLTGWTMVDRCWVQNKTVHSGTFAAECLGSISQSFTVPAATPGSPTLTLWYLMDGGACKRWPGLGHSLATLTDNSLGYDVAGWLCGLTDYGWTKVSSELTAGHSYTLTLFGWGYDYHSMAFDDISVD